VRIALAFAAACLCSCGYHVAGHTNLMPASIHTICVPAFGNATTRYKLTDRLAEAIAKEFISRTHYRVVSDPNTADAVLNGTVINYISYATVADPVTGRATAVDLRVYLRVSLTERATGKVLFTRPSMEVRERYEVSVDPRTYFDESDSALDRASRQVAATVVTAILTNF
jgi:RNase P/RNase MRP subunit p29